LLRFLLTPRWLGFGAFIIALAVACVFLGMWQHDRHEQRQHRIHLIERHAEADPIDIEHIAPADESWPESEEWMRVRATGRYDQDHQFVIKFQQRDSRPGVDVLTPLVLSDGAAVLVDRGWTPTQDPDARPEDVPAAPAGDVTVTGWLRADSSADGQAVRPENGQIRAISSRALADELPYRLSEGYIALREQDPELEQLTPAEPPDLGIGVNLFYSWQWYFFSGLAVFGFFWFVRAELRDQRKKRSVTPG